MKYVWLVALGIVFVLIVLGLHLYVHEPVDSANPVDCYMDCLQLEMTTNVIGNGIVKHIEPHIVLSFRICKDGRYDLYYGDESGASLMRSGEMNAKLWGRVKAMSWKRVSPFWCPIRRLEMVVATNSVVCVSQDNLDVLRCAVSNAIPVGMRMFIDEVNSLVWNFLSPADTNQFMKKEEWMR